MKMEEIESIVYEIVSDFFHGATVIWAEQVNTKPTLPFVTIKTGNINRTRFPIIDEEGRRFYPCSTILEINLYTKGKPVMVGTKVTGNYANTSASDLQDFFSYLDSENIVDKLAMNGIDISLEGPIRDLTNLQPSHGRSHLVLCTRSQWSVRYRRVRNAQSFRRRNKRNARSFH